MKHIIFLVISLMAAGVFGQNQYQVEIVGPNKIFKITNLTTGKSERYPSGAIIADDLPYEIGKPADYYVDRIFIKVNRDWKRNSQVLKNDGILYTNLVDATGAPFASKDDALTWFEENTGKANGVSSYLELTDTPQNTSDFFNDGANGVDPYITNNDLVDYSLQINDNVNDYTLTQNATVVGSINKVKLINNLDGTYTHIDADGLNTLINTNDTNTVFVDNNDGTFSYTNENAELVTVQSAQSVWDNPDSTTATYLSTDIETDKNVEFKGNLTASNLPQTSDKGFLLAIDETTGEISKQAIPSSAAIGSSIENKLLVKQGNAGKTVAAVTFAPMANSGLAPTLTRPTDTGNANTIITALSDHGGLWVNGDFVGNVEKGREYYLELFEGDYIFATGGFTGVYMMSNNAWMPFLHTGFGGKEFSIWVFRNATAGSPAQIGVLVGDQESEIILSDDSGNIVYQGTHDALDIVKINIDNGGGTNTQREYRLTTTGDVSVAKLHGVNGVDPLDCSVVFPALAEPLVGHGRNGVVTSYDTNEGQINIFVRDGVTGASNVSYGASHSVNGYGNDARLGANGAMVVVPQNRVACYSGADADGSELVPFTPVSWLPNMVGIPLHQAGQQPLSIISQFETNLYFFDSDNNLIYTGRATRANTTDQRHPAAQTVWTNNAVFGGLKPSYVVADAPIDLKINLLEPDRWLANPADGTRGSEETIMHGVSTDNFIKPRLNHATGEWQVYNTLTNTWERG